ncbi:hypothetical protein ACI6Q2_00160 [Chitinophagaceae bacterium LWZ2-11]
MSRKRSRLFFAFTSIIVLCCTLTLKAQTINNQWPAGKYKFGYSNLKESVVLSLNLADNNRFYSTLLYKNLNDTTRGSYKVIGDTIYFSSDIRYSGLPAYYKLGKGLPSQNIVIQLDSLIKYADTYLFLAVQPTFKKDKMELIGYLLKNAKANLEAESEDHGETLQKSYYISLPKSDSLFLYSTVSFLDTTIYSLSIPKNADTLVVNCKNILTPDGNKFAPIQCYKGESTNELVFVSPNYPNLYYANAFLEKDLAATLPQADPRYASLLSIENVTTTILKKKEIDYSRENADSTVTNDYADKTTKDTIPYYRSYNKAVANANINNKYVLMYYQPSGGTSGSAKKQLKDLEELANSYHTIKEFNNKFSVFIANDTDKLLFRDYGVKKFPALVITDNAGKALYASYGYSLSDFSSDLIYNSSYYDTQIQMLQKLHAHEINTTEAEKIKTSDSKIMITQYLKDVESVKDLTGGSDDNEESTKNTYKSKLQLTYDTALVYTCINKLISQTTEADTTLAQFIIDFYPVDVAASYLAMPDTANDKKYYDKAFKYLVHNYKDLSKYAYNIKDDYYSKDSALYAYLNKSITGIYTTTESLASTYTDDTISFKELLYTARHNQLLLRRYLIDQVPELTHFQMPLLLNMLNLYADSLNMSTQYIDWSRNYFNTLITDAVSAKKTIDSLNNILYAQMPAEYVVAMPDNAYSIINTDDYSSEQTKYLNKIDDENKSQPIYFRAIYANIFNNAAWYLYTHKQSNEYLKDALKWSKASLTIEPKSPYYLDTYAHLLYVTGNKAEAIQYEQRAVDESNNKQSKYYIDKDIHKTMVKDLAKMQAGREL